MNGQERINIRHAGSPAKAGAQSGTVDDSRAALLREPSQLGPGLRRGTARRLTHLIPLLALAACGAARELKPRDGETLPVAPYGARVTPTRDQLVKPTMQQRPARTDDLLTSSDARRSDEFDLPPPD